MSTELRHEPITDPVELNRIWAALMLTPRLAVAESILRGDPVRAWQLERAALVRALRGEPLPPPDAYVLVSVEMLDAIAEAGPFA